MAYIRSGYKTFMKMRKDSDELTEVIWYRCLPGAKDFPSNPSFGTLNEWNGHGTSDVGEQPNQPRPWYNSRPPVPFAGKNFCGTLEDFRGQATVETPDLPLSPAGWASCCEVLATGLLWNGNSTQWGGVALVSGPGGLLLDGNTTSVQGGGQSGGGSTLWNGRSEMGPNVFIGIGGTLWDGVSVHLDHPGFVSEGGSVYDGSSSQSGGDILMSMGGTLWDGDSIQFGSFNPDLIGGTLWNGHSLQLGSGDYYPEGGTLWGGDSLQNPIYPGGTLWGGDSTSFSIP